MEKAPLDLPLAGITVLDLTRVLAGPIATQILADLGARVIKIEQPSGGDDSRAIGPFLDGVSAYFLSVNRNKESIALDLKTPSDRKIFECLLDRADILVENFRPGTMEKLGYGWTELHDRFPQLIVTSVSGFGQTGPFREKPAYDMVVQAMSGMMSVTGFPDASPCRVGVSIGDLGAGLYAVIGTQAALWKRTNSGLGERVDVSMLDCQLALLENAVARLGATGSVPIPTGSRHPSMTPFDVFDVADGRIVIAVGNEKHFQSLCELLGFPELANDQRFKTNSVRSDHHAALKELMEERLRGRSRAEWIELLSEKGIPTGEYNTVAQIVGHPQIQARNMLATVETPGGAALSVVGNPLRAGREEKLVRRQPPALDSDRDAILADLGLGKSQRIEGAARNAG